MARRGRLIALEGIDGSGKSAQAALLQLALERFGHEVIVIKAKETGQNEVVANFIKTFDIKTDSVAFMFLYQALHRQQYEAAKTAMDKGMLVIADRWDTSFFVYHDIMGPLTRRPKNWLKILNTLAFENLNPDINFYINIPVDIAIDRRIIRGDIITSREDESKFYTSISAEYEKLLGHNKYCHIIDGTLSIEELHQKIIKTVLTFIDWG